MQLNRLSSKKLSATSVIVSACVLLVSACSVEGAPPVDENVDQVGMTWEEFQANVYQEPDTGVYIVNGDEPIVGDRELRRFYEDHFQRGALIVHTVSGVDQKWSATQRLNLTYCVGSSFGANKPAVVNAMLSATASWAAAANNLIKFVHVSAQDGSCTSSNNNVLFDVNQVSGQPYLARAFFPDSARSTRNVLVDSSSFGNLSPWTLAGVLRHELGHVLGFRHEHTRPEAATCFEDSNWRALTTYDSASVMHYPQCNGTQTGDLLISQKDKDGAIALYGGGGGGGGTCGHDKCATGAALVAASCGSVVQAVCTADSYCCSNSWDSTCVSEGRTIGKSLKCAEATGTCSHSPCTSGTKLTNSCDAAKSNCVSKVCAKDPYCCNTSWDSTCVGEVASICGNNCN